MFRLLLITFVTFLLQGCWLFGTVEKPKPPDTREFLPETLQRYDFLLDRDKITLTVQFREGGREGDGLTIGTPDHFKFADQFLQHVNVVGSVGEFLEEGQIAGGIGNFPISTEKGTLELIKDNKSYFHEIEIPNAYFGKFQKEYDRKTLVKLPFTNGEKLLRGRFKIKVKRQYWTEFIIWVPGNIEEKEYVLGQSKEVFIETIGGKTSLVLNLASIRKASDNAFFSVGLFGVFPCNSGDDLPLEDQKKGLQCTYEIPYQDFYLTGQAPKPVDANKMNSNNWNVGNVNAGRSNSNANTGFNKIANVAVNAVNAVNAANVVGTSTKPPINKPSNSPKPKTLPPANTNTLVNSAANNQ